MKNEIFDENSNKPGSDQLMLNLAEGVITTNGINPISNNLVAIFGNGYEKDNRHAIFNWVVETIEGWSMFPDRPLQMLNENFKDKLEIITDSYS